MATLIFILTILLLLIFCIIAVVNSIKRRPLEPVFKKIGYVAGGYTLIWLVFKFLQAQIPVPFGTDVCFDGWCATVTNVEQSSEIQKQFSAAGTDSTCFIMHIRMSNHARGIAQTPSEPRIHIQDDHHHSWSYSKRGQQLLENISGKQPGIDSKLDLHELKETMLVFFVPKTASGLNAIIEEGPSITNLLFAEDKSVFFIK